LTKKNNIKEIDKKTDEELLKIFINKIKISLDKIESQKTKKIKEIDHNLE